MSVRNLKIMELIEDHGISEQQLGKTLRDEAYSCARGHLEKHKSKVVKLVDRLVEYGQVNAAEFVRLMQDDNEAMRQG